MTELNDEYRLPIVGQDALRLAVDEARQHGSSEFEDRMYYRMGRSNSGLLSVLAETFHAAGIVDARRRAASQVGMVLTHQLIDYQALLDAMEAMQTVEVEQVDAPALYARMHAPVVKAETVENIRAEIIERGSFDFLDEADALLERHNPKLSFGVYSFMSNSSFRSPETMEDGRFAMVLTHKFLAAQALANEVGEV